MKLSEKMDNTAGPASYWVDEVAQLEAENERLRKAINRALDLDSRSSTEAGWKRDIVKAIKNLREALFEGE